MNNRGPRVLIVTAAGMLKGGVQRWALVLVAVVMAATVVGCGTHEPTATGLSPEINRLIAEEATEAQHPYLEDGVVSPAEREGAFLAWVACVEGNGVEVLDYTLRDDGETISTTSNLDDAAEERVIEDCRREEYRVVAIVFREQNARSAQEEADWVQQTTDCMREQGAEAPDSATLDDLLAVDPLIAGRCYDAARGR